MVFFRFPFHSGIRHISSDNDSTDSSTIYKSIASYLGSTDFSLVYNGRALPQGESVQRNANILVTFSLPGGKGGFGSMLRAIGAQIEKTTNRAACRDLSGRRLRDINEEQRLKKWILKESEREAEKARRWEGVPQIQTQAPLQRLRVREEAVRGAGQGRGSAHGRHGKEKQETLFSSRLLFCHGAKEEAPLAARGHFLLQ